uniref:Uncharacterized protein n=1 Tax=Timema bartmani TaxID=61472 RepID=A0A7R9EQ51_9NEOP|nr:unnamed protein product [Timema bartmani]
MFVEGEWKTFLEKSLSTPDRYSNLNLPVLFSLIHCESSAALDHVATEMDPVASEVDPNVAYCFQFTWMGPSYDNSTTNNSTCSDLTFEACKKPLVVTNDQTPPNTTTLWENYNSHVACKMAKGHVCAKWIYSFSGAELKKGVGDAEGFGAIGPTFRHDEKRRLLRLSPMDMMQLKNVLTLEPRYLIVLLYSEPPYLSTLITPLTLYSLTFDRRLDNDLTSCNQRLVDVLTLDILNS